MTRRQIVAERAFFEVDVASACAATRLMVDAPQATLLNSHAGGSHVARRRSLRCCATRDWSLAMARLEAGGALHSWGRCNFLSMSQRVSFWRLADGAKRRLRVY